MAGHDPKDTTSVDRPVPDYEAAVGRSVKGLKIGVPKEYRVDGMAPEIETLWEEGVRWLKAAGAEIIDVSLPHTKYALPAYYIVARRKPLLAHGGVVRGAYRGRCRTCTRGTSGLWQGSARRVMIAPMCSRRVTRDYCPSPLCALRGLFAQGVKQSSARDTVARLRHR